MWLLSDFSLSLLLSPFAKMDEKERLIKEMEDEDSEIVDIEEIEVSK